jgi:hypothetical protein
MGPLGPALFFLGGLAFVLVIIHEMRYRPAWTPFSTLKVVILVTSLLVAIAGVFIAVFGRW